MTIWTDLEIKDELFDSGNVPKKIEKLIDLKKGMKYPEYLKNGKIPENMIRDIKLSLAYIKCINDEVAIENEVKQFVKDVIIEEIKLTEIQ